MMKVVISGGSGFIGKHINQEFTRLGLEVLIISRSLYADDNSDQLSLALTGCDVVINLAGASINHRWSKDYKQLIHHSRIQTTRKLVEAINGLQRKPQLLISTSAVGAYPDGMTCDESETTYGTDFLANVCHDWEVEARRISPEVRLAITRFGVVLANDGGAFPLICRPFNMYLGGKISSGKQGFSWIHINDLIAALLFIIETPALSDIINLTAPDTVTNEDFTQTLSGVMNRPAIFSIPAWVIRLLMGERSDMLLHGSQVYPGKLFKTGFSFRYQTLRAALRDLYKFK